MTPGSALIWGVGGQDGALLARLLLEKGYRVFGTSRGPATPANLTTLRIADAVTMKHVDPVDAEGVERVVAEVLPDEIYYLSAQSSVGRSFAQPEATFAAAVTGLGNVLNAVSRSAPNARVFNAASGECFGDCTAGSPARETTAFDPRSPYAEAKAAGHRLVEQQRAAGMWAASAFLFPHESPLRPTAFVTGKIVAAVRRIAGGDGEPLELGDLSVVRDWGWAADYVEAMWRMLQLDSPADLILATGSSISLEAFVAAAFREAGLDWRDHVVSSPQLRRPSEVAQQHADPSLALDLIGWRAGLAGEAVAARLVRDALTSSAA